MTNDNPRPPIRSVESGLVEVELSGGRVFQGNPVGPEAWALTAIAYPAPEEPKEPKNHGTNEAGTPIVTSVPRGDPRWAEYVEDLHRYAKDKVAYNLKIQEAYWLNFFDGTLEVPEDWDIPRGHKWLGVQLADDPDERLIQYVRLEVIKTLGDEDLLARAIRNEIDEEERDRYRRLFRGEEGQGTAAGDPEQERDQ